MVNHNAGSAEEKICTGVFVDDGVPKFREADRIGGKKSRKILTEAFLILKDCPLYRDDMEKAYEKCKELGKKHKIKSYKKIFYSALYAAYHDLDIDEVHPRCSGGYDLERITSITKGFE